MKKYKYEEQYDEAILETTEFEDDYDIYDSVGVFTPHFDDIKYYWKSIEPPCFNSPTINYTSFQWPSFSYQVPLAKEDSDKLSREIMFNNFNSYKLKF